MLYTYTTERLTLKILGEGYAPLTLEFYRQNREHFSHWDFDHTEEYYTVSYQERVLAAEEAQFLRSQAVRYYLFLPGHEIPIGTVGFQHIRPAPDASCQLGYRLDRTQSGQGYMTEALTCLIPKVFFFYRLHRIEADILPENMPSIRLIERLGFTMEGIARGRYLCGGSYRDYNRYSLLADDEYLSKY